MHGGYATGGVVKMMRIIFGGGNSTCGCLGGHVTAAGGAAGAADAALMKSSDAANGSAPAYKQTPNVYRQGRLHGISTTKEMYRHCC